MKKFIKEKYANIILQICTDYKNNHREENSLLSRAVDRALETLDKYSFYILGMGYMLYMEDLPVLKDYISSMKGQDTGISDSLLEETVEYLEKLEYQW